MSEQIQRGRQRRREPEQTESVTTVEAPSEAAEIVEGAECCIADIDEALATCCVTEADPVEALREAAEALREQVKPKPYAEWTDDERIDAGDPGDWDWGTYEKFFGRRLSWAERRAARDVFDESYQRVVGVSNQRDCGCGCG